MIAAAAAIEEAIPDAFAGDAHALFMTIYKDPTNDISLRLDAAKAAIRYEKPAMSSVQAEHSGSLDIRAFLLTLGEPD
jgi:hypothetical protein